MEKLNKRLCLVCGKRGVRLFGVPSDDERMKKWLELLDKLDLLSHSKAHLVNNAKVCEDHFATWAFGSTLRTRLIGSALPVLAEPPLTALAIRRLPALAERRLPALAERRLPALAERRLPASTELPSPALSEPLSPALSEPPSAALAEPPLPASTKSEITFNQRVRISGLKKKTAQRKAPSFLNILRDKLTVDQYDFVKSQIKQAGRSKKRRRWSIKDKAFALNIYLQSPSTYRILRQRLSFPSRATLKRYTLNVAKAPGFCPNLIKCLQGVTAKMQDEGDRLCILCWDEMKVKEGLTYCPRRDVIEGFESCTAAQPLPASYALVFMARGIKKSWKQVLGYFFIAKGSSNVDICRLINQSIQILRECNLKVVATVCDQGPSNLEVYGKLGVSTAKPFFFLNEEKVFALYDPPHLLKCTRNNFKNHGVHFTEYKVDNQIPREMYASWSYIEKLYEHDIQQKFRSCPKLTKEHVVVPGLAKLNVKLAAQVLSNSVAAALCALASEESDFLGFGPKALETAEFVGTVNKLFDSLNLLPFSSKPLNGALVSTSAHLDTWAEMIKWIETWKFCDSQGRKIVPAIKKGWIITLRAMEGICKSLEEQQVKFLLLNRFNQDCLADTFSSIRRRGGFRDNPDCYQFCSAMHEVIIHNFLKKSSVSNCAEDSDSVLVDFSQFNKVELASLLQEPDDVYLTQSKIDIFEDSFFEDNLVIDENDLSIADFSFIDCNVISYIAGYHGKRLLEKVTFNCERCRVLLVGKEVLDPSKYLLYFKEYRKTEFGLKWPTDDLLEYFTDLVEEIAPIRDAALFNNQVCRKLVARLTKNVHMSVFKDHRKHENTAKHYFVNAFVLMMVKLKVKCLNLKHQDKTLSRSLSKKRKLVHESNQ